jgi:predicted CopG family antitoxin
MKRTQIYLDKDIYLVLQKESALKNKNISSIIRDTLREKFLNKKRTNAIEAAAGIWKDRNIDVEAYIRKLRKGTRLKELYGENYDND